MVVYIVCCCCCYIHDAVGVVDMVVRAQQINYAETAKIDAEGNFTYAQFNQNNNIQKRVVVVSP